MLPSGRNASENGRLKPLIGVIRNVCAMLATSGSESGSLSGSVGDGDAPGCVTGAGGVAAPACGDCCALLSTANSAAIKSVIEVDEAFGSRWNIRLTSVS